ncbi:ankyrin repeat family A protein 2-like isoform X3 [Symsagittifera roscoffensis]|uniref:ankyrin repeat family A protein 2-like isoform X3 n=1 Tax=Symsagittifera roscoffensis TaxID=84072 RepID=UPI00307C9864
MYQKKTQNSENIRQIIKSNNPLRLVHALQTTPELLNIIARHGLRPIQQAIVENKVILVEILLDHGADTSVLKPDGSSLLHLAILNSTVDLVRLLLKAGCNPCIADERGETPLFLAVHLDDLKIAKDLILHGASALVRDTNSCNVFHLAALGDTGQELAILLCEAVESPEDLEDALCSTSKSKYSIEPISSPIETAILTKAHVALKVFLSFLSMEAINRRFNCLIDHCLKSKTSLDVVESLVAAGYHIRRELATLDLQAYDAGLKLRFCCNRCTNCRVLARNEKLCSLSV